MYWSQVQVPAAQRPKLWVRLFRPTFDVSGAAHSWMRKGAFTQLQKYVPGVHGSLEKASTPSGPHSLHRPYWPHRESTSTTSLLTTRFVP